MATQTIDPDSPTPTKVRNFDTVVAPAVFNAVEKAVSGALTPAAARTAITTALGTINNGGDPTQPVNWGEFVDCCQRVIDCVEANTDPVERRKLFAVAGSYLQDLINDIAGSEIEYQNDRGLFMLNSQTLNLDYFLGVLGQANAEGQTISFEVS